MKKSRKMVARVTPLHGVRLHRSHYLAFNLASGLLSAAAAFASLPSLALAAAGPPPIRTFAQNTVPACVTPERLNSFLIDQISARGYQLEPRFRSIAHDYRRHGERFRVRWDYAFFQMALETNFLSFRRGDGKRGDVHPSQNNFAGLGTTGGGVPGDRYPDISTGVLAQIQHLVVYSGERLERPVGHRTRLKQDVILQSMGKIARQRPVTFGDLARRWAADRHYDRSIERLAGLFFTGYCPSASSTGARPTSARKTQIIPPHRTAASAISYPPAVPAGNTAAAPRRPIEHSAPKTPLPIRKPVAGVDHTNPTKIAPVTPQIKASPQPNQATQLNLKAPETSLAAACHVQVASFGGNRTVLIESVSNDTVSLTALNVHPGFEVAMAANFIASHAPNGRTIGAFASRDTAVQKAHDICRQRVPVARQ